jgi:hypothetical protein
MEILLVPPLAFLAYAAVLAAFSRLSSRGTRRAPLYAGGEQHPAGAALIGYRGFFVFALFFAVLHLGALMLATAIPSPAALFYLGGVAFALLALMLG